MALAAYLTSRIREWVGSTPDDTIIETTFGLAGNQTVEATALSILRQRRADMLANPLQFSVQGDYSENRQKNLDALDAQISSLESLLGIGEDVVSTGLLTRSCER